jgi:hypothetical protein
VTRKVALPELNFNNGHNMWANRDQSLIYNTEWFGNRLVAFERKTGKLTSVLEVGADPAHVMTRTDTGQVHTTLNGEDAVIEASPGARGIDRRIPCSGQRSRQRIRTLLDERGRQADGHAERQLGGFDADRRVDRDDHVQAGRGSAADRGRHDARLEQVLRCPTTRRTRSASST